MGRSKNNYDPEHLLGKNKAWAKQLTESDPQFFRKLSEQQNPDYLWIGCSDSRVSANTIVDVLPGEIFVHRNIANLVINSDLNCLSVIQYAVEVLKVGHIIVCGHYGCGGIQAAMEESDHGLLDNWLGLIRETYADNEPEIKTLATEKERVNRLCELNVAAQVKHLTRLPVIRRAWESGSNLTIHGWIYSLDNGVLNDLGVSVNKDPGSKGQ